MHGSIQNDAGGGVGGISDDQETLRCFLGFRGVEERVGFRIDLGVVVDDAGSGVLG